MRKWREKRTWGRGRGDGGRRRRVEVEDKGGSGMDIFYFVYYLLSTKIMHIPQQVHIATANLLTIILHRRR